MQTVKVIGCLQFLDHFVELGFKKAQLLIYSTSLISTTTVCRQHFKTVLEQTAYW